MQRQHLSIKQNGGIDTRSLSDESIRISLAVFKGCRNINGLV